MIQELLDQQKRYLDFYFQNVSSDRVEQIMQLVVDCKGTIVLSGVGKSGHVAQKITATLLSTSTRAYYLDPTHAIHGDLGFVGEQDLFLAFSKNGESQELLELLPFIQKRGARSIAIVSNERSRLAQACNYSISLPVERELCPFDLAPTTSTAVQMLFGDLLAVALMRAKQIPIGEIARNHPGGFIGRRISLKVSDLMRKEEDIPLCSPHDRLIDVLHELSTKRCGCLLVVVEKKTLRGIFTNGDLRRDLETRGACSLESVLGERMTPSPRAISSELLALDAMRFMEEDPSRPVTVMPVLENKTVVGLLRMHDILQAGLS
jgi:arabinose-5-phosphate isomerase